MVKQRSTRIVFVLKVFSDCSESGMAMNGHSFELLLQNILSGQQDFVISRSHSNRGESTTLSEYQTLPDTGQDAASLHANIGSLSSRPAEIRALQAMLA